MSATQYRTIVADPPWHYDSWPASMSAGARYGHDARPDRKALDYPSMTVEAITALPVAGLADPVGCHLYLWTTNRYLPDVFDVLKAWGFRYSQTLIWAKTPMGQGPGGVAAQNAEYLILARRGTLKHLRRIDSVWHNWPRTAKHSKKPEHALDLIESLSPGPYLEMFSRRHRLGWDVWGNEVASSIALPLDGAA